MPLDRNTGIGPGVPSQPDPGKDTGRAPREDLQAPQEEMPTGGQPTAPPTAPPPEAVPAPRTDTPPGQESSPPPARPGMPPAGAPLFAPLEGQEGSESFSEPSSPAGFDTPETRFEEPTAPKSTPPAGEQPFSPPPTSQVFSEPAAQAAAAPTDVDLAWSPAVETQIAARTGVAPPVEDSAPEPAAEVKPPQEVLTQNQTVEDPLARELDGLSQVAIGDVVAESDLPTKRIAAAERAQKDRATAATKREAVGSAVNDILIGDPSVKMEEISFNTEKLFRAWEETTSGMRELIATVAPELDQNSWNDDPDKAKSELLDFFNSNDVIGLIEKTPTNDEASAHTRVVRAHDGAGTRVHPVVAPVMFNADFDGDSIKVSFHPDARSGAKSAMMFLIGTEGDLKIDPDYFAPIAWEGGRDGVRKFITEEFADLALTPEEISGLTEAIMQSWEQDAVEAGLKSLVRWAARVGSRFTGIEADRVTGRILFEIYEINRKIRRVKMMIDGYADQFGVLPRLEHDYLEDEGMLGDEADEVGPSFPLKFPRPRPGGAFANQKDLERDTGTPIGMVEGKNQHFRITAGWGKIARMLDLVLGRTDQKRERSIEQVLSMMMSGVEDFDESSMAVSEYARMAVIEKVGYPPTHSDEAFMRWLGQFTKEYNKAAFIVNSAASRVNLDKTVAPSERYYMPAIPKEPARARREAARKQFHKVYGGIRMGRLFEGRCPGGWENVTLDTFVHRNRMARADLGSPKTQIKTIDQFIGRLADMRTASSRRIHDELWGSENKKGAIANQFALLDTEGKGVTRLAYAIEQMQEARKLGKGPMNLDRELETLVEAFFLLGGDLFLHLGLDNPAAFQTTEIGRKFLEAGSVDEFVGVLYEAVVRYRFAPVLKYRDLYTKAKKAEQKGEYSDLFYAELDAIASSSTTWDVIVRKYLDGARLDGQDIIEFMLSDVGGRMKEEVLNTTVQNDALGNPNQAQFEIASDLLSDPKGLYGRSRFLMQFGVGQLLDDIRDANDKVDAYGETNWTYCLKSVQDAKKAHKSDIKKFLKRLAEDPTANFEMRAWMIADAILSSLEKTYASTEKAQQEDAVAFLYSQVSYMLNAGVWSDLAVGGDFMLNKIALDRFWRAPGILARLLSDPDFEITVYDGTGELTLNREVMVGKRNPTTDELWDWLEAHPRAAMALRMTSENNSVGESGASWEIATMSLADTIKQVVKHNHAADPDSRSMRLLVDHPGFHALLSLTVDFSGTKRYQARDELSRNVVAMTRFIRGYIKGPGDVDIWELYGAVTDLFKASFGEERYERIREAHKLGREQDAAEAAGELVPLAEDVRDTEDYQLGQMHSKMSENLVDYATELTRAGVPGYKRMSTAEAAKLFKLTDGATQRMYFDTVQVMSAAKTALSTSVNGGESRRNAALMLLAYISPQPCGADEVDKVGIVDFANDWSRYVGRKAWLGGKTWVAIDETTWEDIAVRSGEDGMVTIEIPAVCTSRTCACVRHSTADQSTNYTGGDTPAFVRLLTIVRTLSAESLNLKVKTKGDDGRDSIVKNPLFASIDTKLTARVKAAYEKGGLPAARIKLAEHLQQTFDKMGYSDEIIFDDYVNIAQVMIRELEGPTLEDGTTAPADIKILAMGQLNALVKQALAEARSADPGLTPEEAVEKAELTLEDLERIDSSLDVEKVMSGFHVTRERQLRSDILSQRESSMGRNMELVAQIVEETGVQPIGDAELDAFEDSLREPFEREFKRWRKFAGRVRKDHTFGSENRRSYRIVGVSTPSESTSKLAVGPRNAYIIHADSPKAVDNIVKAYKLGITVFLEGELSDTQWDKIANETGIVKEGGLDKNQGTEVYSDNNVLLGRIIPTFDIRLNGGNTTLHEGAFNAGVVWALAKDVFFFYENKINEHSAGDAEFVPTGTFARNLRHRVTGAYTMPVNTAFGTLLEDAKRDREDATRTDEMVPQTADAETGERLLVFGDEGVSYTDVKDMIESTQMYRDGRIYEIVVAHRLDQGASQPVSEFPYAEVWAEQHGVKVKPFVVNWHDGTTQQGTRRNDAMASYATAAIVINNGRKPSDYMAKALARRKNGIDPKRRLVVTASVPAEGLSEVTIATRDEIIANILQPYEEGRAEDVHIDLGHKVITPGSAVSVRGQEAVMRFIARAGEMDEHGLIRSARPGEVIGFARAQVGERVYYHPIRPFESDKDSGAPTDMTIESVSFDRDRMDIVVKWVHEGTMLGRFFKLFEGGYAANKFMARPDAIPDIKLENNISLAGYVARPSTASRRMLMRRQQKMATVMYMARMAPYGYNLATVPGMLDKHPDLKELVLYGQENLTAWKKATEGDKKIAFHADPKINGLLNMWVQRAMRYNIDPVVVLASEYRRDPDSDKMTPSNLWFNFQLFFDRGYTFQNEFMRLMHMMNNSLCPDGFEGDTSETLFDEELQVAVPVLDDDGKEIGYQRVDLYGGFHFLDEHYSGRSAAGSTVAAYSLPTVNTLMAGGKKMTKHLLDLILDWGNIGNVPKAALSFWARSQYAEDD